MTKVPPAVTIKGASGELAVPAFTHIPLCTLGEVPGEEILKQGGVGESEAGNRRVFTTEESGGSEILLETFNVGIQIASLEPSFAGHPLMKPVVQL